MLCIVDWRLCLCVFFCYLLLFLYYFESVAFGIRPQDLLQSIQFAWTNLEINAIVYQHKTNLRKYSFTLNIHMSSPTQFLSHWKRGKGEEEKIWLLIFIHGIWNECGGTGYLRVCILSKAGSDNIFGGIDVSQNSHFIYIVKIQFLHFFFNFFFQLFKLKFYLWYLVDMSSELLSRCLNFIRAIVQ